MISMLGLIIASMALSADEAYVHEHCKVLLGLPIVLDTPGAGAGAGRLMKYT